MIDKFSIKLAGGQTVQVDCVVIGMQGKAEKLLFLAFDFEANGGADFFIQPEKGANVEVVKLGKLQAVTRFDLRLLRLLLLREGWDWKAWPDPEVILYGPAGKIILGGQAAPGLITKF